MNSIFTHALLICSESDPNFSAFSNEGLYLIHRDFTQFIFSSFHSEKVFLGDVHDTYTPIFTENPALWIKHIPKGFS